MVRERALARWETNLANCEVTPQAIWPIAKSLKKMGRPKASSAMHGPLGPMFYPINEANINCRLLRKPVQRACLVDAQVHEDIPDNFRPCDVSKEIKSLN
jgi:hypothetical protein